MTTLAPLFGVRGERLTGIESRCLRASLNLERRHVVALVNATGGDRGEELTIDRLTAWERSKGHGYPLSVSEQLEALDRAVEALSWRWIKQCPDEGDGRGCTLWRPSNALAFETLDPSGLNLTWEERREVEAIVSDFWTVLLDVAICRTALFLRDQRESPGDWPVRVEVDR